MKIERTVREVDGKRLVAKLEIVAETMDEARVLTEYSQGVEAADITLQPHLAETLAVIREFGEVPTAAVAEALALDSATATNNRIAALYKRGFLNRRAACVAAGGRHYLYSAVADEVITP